jgi:uncharacterized protein
MIFVDTGGWFASLIPNDADHRAATAWLARNRQPLITTDYVIDETLTLLRARGQDTRARAWGERIFSGSLALVHCVTPNDIVAAWQVFRQYQDKDWSFTDCTSKVVMEALGITHAFAFDDHFDQFGSLVVVP